MNVALHTRFQLLEADSPAVCDDVYRFRYRIYVELMGRRQKYADHKKKTIVEPLDETATIYAAYLDKNIVGTIRGNRFCDPQTKYYRTIYRVDDRFDYLPHQMTLTTKLMFEPSLQRTMYPIKLILHYAEQFHFRRGCKIDFLDCNKNLINFFVKFAYLDYQGWIFHSEYGTVRPLCCPTDQIARFLASGSPLGPMSYARKLVTA